MDVYDTGRDDNTYRLIKNEGRGLLIQGTRDWRNYSVSAEVTPFMVRAAGIAARVQGLRRYYALLLCSDGVARLVKMLDEQKVLAEVQFNWEFRQRYAMTLVARDGQLTASVDGRPLLTAQDADRPLEGGAMAIVCDEGRMACGPVRVGPAQ